MPQIPINDPLLHRVRLATLANGLLPQGANVGVCVSGGCDSMVLLTLLARLHLWQLRVFHCNFSLRGEESDQDQARVEEYARRLRVPLEVKRFDTKRYCTEQRLSLEVGTRELRYRWFDSLAREGVVDRFALGHHANDQAETLLLRAIRGAGLQGLASMRTQRGPYCRPLLTITRDELEEWAATYHIPYANDSSNADPFTPRNALRREVLPRLQALNAKAVRHLAHSAALLAEAHETLLIEAQLRYGPIHNGVGKLPNELPAVPSNDPHSGLYWQWLRLRLHALGVSPNDTQRFVEAYRRGEWGVTVQASEARVSLEREGRILLLPIKAPSYRLQVETVPLPAPLDATSLRTWANRKWGEALFAADRLQPNHLALRPWLPGDSLVPLGMKGKRLVSDILTDRKVPHALRNEALVLTHEGNPIWLVGHCLSAKHAVRLDSHAALLVQLFPVAPATPPL